MFLNPELSVEQKQYIDELKAIAPRLEAFRQVNNLSQEQLNLLCTMLQTLRPSEVNYLG